MKSFDGERRNGPRIAVKTWSTARRRGTVAQDKIMITDLSITGFRMRSSTVFPIMATLFVELTSGLIAESRVIWADPIRPLFGCRFTVPLDQCTVDTIALEGLGKRDFSANAEFG